MSLSLSSSQSESIPIVLCGKIPGHRQAVAKIIEPEFHVIAFFDNATTFTSEFPSLLHQTNQPPPRVVVMGGGFTPQEFQEAYNSSSEASKLPWIRPAHTQPGSTIARPSGPPSAETVAKVTRVCLLGHREELEKGGGEGEVWYS